MRIALGLRNPKRLVLFVWLLLMNSCAYHVGDSRSPEQELRVFVPVLENNTVRPLDLNEITSSLRENLEAIRGVVVVTRREDANLQVLGKVFQYDKGWGPTAFKGSELSEISGGLKKDSLSASTVRIHLGIQIEKRTVDGELKWTSPFVESDLYQLSDRLELSRGSAATPQVHNSREALLVKKMADRIFERASVQIVDEF